MFRRLGIIQLDPADGVRYQVYCRAISSCGIITIKVDLFFFDLGYKSLNELYTTLRNPVSCGKPSADPKGSKYPLEKILWLPHSCC